MASAMDTAEIKSAVKDLEKALESNQADTAVDILKQLQKGVVASADLIRETSVGLAVGKLRTHEQEKVSELAKELVKQWRKQVAMQKSGPSPVKNAVQVSKAPSISPALKSESTFSKPVIDTAKAQNATATKSADSPKTPSTPARSAKLDGVNVKVTHDTIRDKCLSLIYDALSSDSTAPSDLILQRSTSIESTIFLDLKSQTGQPYRTKMRELYMNLKDKKNPGLREAVISGDLSPAKLTKMSPQDMASQERQQEDRKIQEENLFKSRGAAPPVAETDAFKCGKCGQRKCTYYQMQTRSADEPMTTFVTCVVCGNRWKFS